MPVPSLPTILTFSFVFLFSHGETIAHRNLKTHGAGQTYTLAGPRASELRPSCVTVTTKSGGAGSSESRTTAEYRRAEYGAAAGPAVFDVEVLNGGGFALRARAVAVDDGGPRVFFSSLGSDDGDVYGGVLVYEDGALAVALDGAPRVHGLAFEADADACGGGWLYYADASRSLIARRPACPASYGAPGDAHERVLERHAAWSRAGHARRRAKWLGWMGRLRYVQGRYAEACAFQLEAAAGKRPYEVLSSLLNAATAALEVSPGGLAQAARILSRAERLAATTGKARERARVVRLARTVAYRRGTAGSPRVDLVRAAEQVSRLEGAYFAFNEAAVAWRAGERSLCAQLAQGASGVFVEAGVTQVADLAQALAGAAGIL